MTEQTRESTNHILFDFLFASTKYVKKIVSPQIPASSHTPANSMANISSSDADAPINAIADYVITGDLNVVIPKMIQYYKKNSK